MKFFLLPGGYVKSGTASIGLLPDKDGEGRQFTAFSSWNFATVKINFRSFAMADDSTGATQKRGRGRPKKDPSTKHEEVEETVAKRARGRPPRKAATEAKETIASEPTKAKRGRGRPKGSARGGRKKAGRPPSRKSAGGRGKGTESDGKDDGSDSGQGGQGDSKDE